MNPPTLGFVGLGRMCAPMSGRLVAAGYTVIAFDLAGTQQRLPAGAIAADSVDDLVARAEIILLSLPDGAASRSVCAQIARAPERQVRMVVDLSTVGIAAARDCAAVLGEAGITYVDAPVSGGTAGARSGSLAMMVGADPDVFEALKPVLAIIAKNCFRVGDAPGQGQAMKLSPRLRGDIMEDTSQTRPSSLGGTHVRYLRRHDQRRLSPGGRRA